MLNAIPIPDEPQAFNAIAARQLVRNTAHVYTDQSLRDELALMGAPVELVDSLLELAGTVRAEAAAV